MEQFVALLDKWAAKLGYQTERIWPEIIRLFWWRAVLEMVVVLVGFTVVSLVFRACMRTNRDRYGDMTAEALIGAIVGGVAGILLFITLLIAVGGNIPTLIAPEAAFILHLLNK